MSISKRWVMVAILALIPFLILFFVSQKMLDITAFILVFAISIVLIVANVQEIKEIKAKKSKQVKSVIDNPEYKRQQTETALKSFQEMIVRKPESYEGWFGCGQCHITLKNYAEAIECLKKSIIINSFAPQAYYLISMAYLESEKPNEALTNLLKLESIKPDTDDLYNLFAQTYEKLNDQYKALAYYNKYLRTCSDNKVKKEILQKIKKIKAGVN